MKLAPADETLVLGADPVVQPVQGVVEDQATVIALEGDTISDSISGCDVGHVVHEEVRGASRSEVRDKAASNESADTTGL